VDAFLEGIFACRIKPNVCSKVYIYGGGVEITEKYSESYAESISKAYEAKFGYKNSEFDKEVSQHILAVESLKKGITRQIHLEKLHRIEKFVELKK
jgi:UDP-N-acetylenolpyruvoylglucosamine reductase